MKIIAGETPAWSMSAVYVDGERIDFYLEADDSVGFVLVVCTEATPQETHVLEKNGVLRTKRVFGNVEIRMNG